MSSVSDTRGVDIDAKCHGDPGTQIGTHVATFDIDKYWCYADAAVPMWSNGVKFE